MLENSQKSRLRKLYQIVGMLVLCISLIALSYNFTMAWFMDQSVTSNGEPNVTIIGTIDINVTTNFNFYNLALAPDTTYYVDGNGKDISTKICTSTKNDIKTVYVRVKFISNRDELTLVFEEGNKWIYNDADEFYYYLGEVGNTDVMFNKGYHVDNSLNNSKANAPVNLTFQIEAIQRPYGAYDAVWTTAPEAFDEFARENSGV